ncbi:MlaD family protein [Tsukamurella paurometabola]|uniref:Virulence factor Mce family protein n=1 Tax=Tsukamurella paurometabola TaxID=2061 RepID=A0A3P8MBV6_TSUPA|nr:MlaD family protein [Tsukamurella paurometabola]UEA84565.1 MlaD family protein [Tsukamurella paurometabola]VDR37133.1 virulence factor Mce family protein [Tsukamurella paurometabola]
MRNPLNRRSVAMGVATLATGALLAGCGSVPFNPSAIPAPGQPGGGDGYVVHLDFTNVLNLPDRARVVFDGVVAGRLQKVTLEDEKAVVDIKIQDGVKVPNTITATLQQDTILGDTYVALKSTPGKPGTPLKAGDTLPTSQTKPPTQIEDILADLANFLGSGSLMQLQDTFSRINTNLPEDPQKLSGLMKTVSQTVVDLGQQSDNVSQAITSVGNLVNTVNENDDVLVALLRPQDDWFPDSLQLTTGAIKVLSRLSDALAPLVFTKPLLDASTATVAGVIKPLMFPGWPDMNGRPANLANLEDLLRNKILPFLSSGAKVNVKELGTNGGVPTSEAARQAVNNLRMVGAVP